MKALVLTPKDKTVAVQDIPIPVPGPSEILVRVSAVALNRVDWLYTANPVAAQDYRVVGSDFAGEVVKVGSCLDKVDDPRVKVGTRVASFVQGACSVNERPGAFAQYVCVEWDLAWLVPDTMSLEEAAGISMCGLTAAQGIFTRLQLPCPFSETEGFSGLGLKSEDHVNVLIYGATASLGLFAAQLVRLSEKFSGAQVNLIGVASASKHDLLRAKPYAFDVLIDYHDADWTEQVKKLTENTGGVHHAVDAVSVSPTVEQVESVLAPEGRFAVYRSPALGKFDINKLRVKPLIGAVWEGLGVEIGYQGASIPANPQARKFAAEFFNFLGSEALQGKVKLESNPVRQMQGGLDKIAEEGLALVSPNKVPGVRAVSAEKVVYTIVFVTYWLKSGTSAIQTPTQQARIFITSSADSFGIVAARQLVERNHEVYLHARNAQRAADARAQCPGAAGVFIADLALVSETKRLANEVNAVGTFDAIIHNAGTLYGPFRKTPDTGIPAMVAVNVLAPYILSCLLTPPKRLIYIASQLHKDADTHVKDILWLERGEAQFQDFPAYCDSKLHVMLLANAVARRFKDTSVLSVHPGWVATKIGGEDAPDKLEDGVETYVMLAEGDYDQSLTGKYFEPKRKLGVPLSECDEVDLQEWVVDACEKIAGLKLP